MHELSLALNLIEIIESHAKTDVFESVHRVVLEIGTLSSIEPDALRLGFEACSKGTCAETASLEIVTTNGHEMRIKYLDVHTD